MPVDRNPALRGHHVNARLAEVVDHVVDDFDLPGIAAHEGVSVAAVYQQRAGEGVAFHPVADEMGEVVRGAALTGRHADNRAVNGDIRDPRPARHPVAARNVAECLVAAVEDQTTLDVDAVHEVIRAAVGREQTDAGLGVSVVHRSVAQQQRLDHVDVGATDAEALPGDPEPVARREAKVESDVAALDVVLCRTRVEIALDYGHQHQRLARVLRQRPR